MRRAQKKKESIFRFFTIIIWNERRVSNWLAKKQQCSELAIQITTNKLILKSIIYRMSNKHSKSGLFNAHSIHSTKNSSRQILELFFNSQKRRWISNFFFDSGVSTTIKRVVESELDKKSIYTTTYYQIILNNYSPNIHPIIINRPEKKLEMNKKACSIPSLSH